MFHCRREIRQGEKKSQYSKNWGRQYSSFLNGRFPYVSMDLHLYLVDTHNKLDVNSHNVTTNPDAVTTCSIRRIWNLKQPHDEPQRYHNVSTLFQRWCYIATWHCFNFHVQWIEHVATSGFVVPNGYLEVLDIGQLSKDYSCTKSIIAIDICLILWVLVKHA